MTQLLYQTDSYLREFEATVAEEHEDGLVLDQTAMYPGGGGQPCDAGVLIGAEGSRWSVPRLSRAGGRIVHHLEGADGPAAGTTVRGEIDWDRRYRLMRTHTAMHILCGVVWRDYQAQVTGGNMEPGRGRLDFEFESLTADLVGEIEQKLNVEVEAARPIHVKILPRDEAFAIPDLIRTKINLLPEGITEVRTVEIEGLDLQADGGTHVANTSEVGPLKILSHKSKGKINKRIVVGLE